MDGEGGAFLFLLGNFSQDSHDFSQRWEKMRDFWGKRGVIFLFSLLFNSLFLILLTFPKLCPIFPKNVGFSGELWERDCFAFVFAVLLQRRRNKTTLKWFGALETSSYNYIICILRL